MSSGMDEVNRSVYDSASAAGWYATRSGLQAPEETALGLLGDLSGARLLDVGVGGGRTTESLHQRVRTYVGVDYAPALVDAARQRFPGVDLRVADARDLFDVDDGSFDVVLFSFNGIDYVSHEDRRLVLAEVNRVLAPGGHFVFSTHNRDWRHFDRLPWQRGIRPSRTWLRQCAQALRHLPRHRRLSRDAIHTDEFAVVNDDAIDYSLMTYYIARDRQRAQLEEAGFEPRHEIALDGRELRLNQADRDSVWIYYVARRP